MDIRIIKAPTQNTIDIIKRRIGTNVDLKQEDFDTVGLVQGKLIEMIVASDIAGKSSGVQVYDLRGSCPQNMIALAIFGDVSSVECALQDISNSSKGLRV